MTRSETSWWKGAIAGAIGGLAGSWTMEQAQAMTSRASGDGLDAAQHATGRPAEWSARTQDQSSGDEPATVQAAEAILQRPLDPKERELAGPVMHYLFGMSVGALYGALAESRGQTTRGFGTGYGMAVWAAADQFGVSALGFARPPADRSGRAEAYSTISHLVFGATLESVRRTVRAVF
jgi:hypothetical protein